MPLPDGLLDEFRADVFFETGTHRGDGVAAAIEAGFGRICSVDISEFAFGWCCHRFADNRGGLDLYLGDSRDVLREVLPGIQSRITFWLDAHWSGGDGYLDGKDAPLAERGKPLLDELQIIGRHRSDHTLLIDDVRMFGKDDYFPTHREVLDAIRNINENYVISYRDSSAGPGDVLVATL